jgi:hypothetical protein
LDNLLAAYNLISTIRFPTRITNGTVSATDNIFVDISHIETGVEESGYDLILGTNQDFV